MTYHGRLAFAKEFQSPLPMNLNVTFIAIFVGLHVEAQMIYEVSKEGSHCHASSRKMS
jgi:hypothetical protein